MKDGCHYYKVTNLNHFESGFSLQQIIDSMPHFGIGTMIRVEYYVGKTGSFCPFENKYYINLHGGILSKVSYEEYLKGVNPKDMDDHDKDMFVENIESTHLKPKFKKGSFVQFISPFNQNKYICEVTEYDVDFNKDPILLQYIFKIPEEGTLKLSESILSKPEPKYPVGTKVKIKSLKKLMYGGGSLGHYRIACTVSKAAQWDPQNSTFRYEMVADNTRHGNWTVAEHELDLSKQEENMGSIAKAHFKKDSIVVCLEKPNGTLDYISPGNVYQINKDSEKFNVKKDNYDDYTSCTDLPINQEGKLWRYANRDERFIYSIIEKPFSVKHIPTEVNQYVEVVRKDETHMAWNENGEMKVGMVGKIKLINRTGYPCTVVEVYTEDESDYWSYNIACLKLISKSEFESKRKRKAKQKSVIVPAGSYIVVLDQNKDYPNVKKRYVFKQKESLDHMSVYHGIMSKSGFFKEFKFNNTDCLKEWRYATEYEKYVYDAIGKPYSIDEYPTKKEQHVIIDNKSEDYVSWIDDKMSVGQKGIVKSIHKNIIHVETNTGLWNFDITSVKLPKNNKPEVKEIEASVAKPIFSKSYDDEIEEGDVVVVNKIYKDDPFCSWTSCMNLYVSQVATVSRITETSVKLNFHNIANHPDDYSFPVESLVLLNKAPSLDPGVDLTISSPKDMVDIIRSTGIAPVDTSGSVRTKSYVEGIKSAKKREKIQIKTIKVKKR